MSRLRRLVPGSLRRLAQRRGLAIAVVTVLALAIGANAALVSLVDRLLFRPLPVPGVDRIVRVFPLTDEGGVSASVSYPELAAMGAGSRTLDRLAGFSPGNTVTLATPAQRPSQVRAELVSGEYFPLLQVRPRHGRLLLPGDDRAGAPAVAVLAHAYWAAAFGADEEVLGTVVQINREPVEIVGVAPAGFVGASLEMPPDLWMPTATIGITMPVLAAMEPLTNARLHWLYVLGRLAPGATAPAAAGELEGVRRGVAAELGVDLWERVRVLPAAEVPLHPDDLAPALRLGWLVTGTGVLVLLLGATVAGSLLLVDGERRAREVAVRRSLGAAPARVAGQLLAEAAWLAGVAAAAAFFVAGGVRKALVALLPAELPLPVLAGDATLPGRLMLLCTLAAAVSVLVAGVAPALRGARTDLSLPLKSGEAGSGSRRRMPLRHAFVVVQIAISAVVVVGAALLVRSVQRITAVDPGFPTRGAVVAALDVSKEGYAEPARAVFWRRLLDELAGSPGVEAAALAKAVPVQGAGMRVTVQPDGYAPAAGEDLAVALNVVSPGYFAALGVPLTAGRPFDAADRAGGAPVAVVNQAFADRFWGGGALGRIVRDLGPDGEYVQVVGVARDHHTLSLREPAPPTLYLPLAQAPHLGGGLTVLLRGEDEDQLHAALRAAVARLDPALPVFGQATLEQHLGATLERERALAALLSGLALLSLLLALLGLYAVLAHGVESRRRELGVRTALGATWRGLAALVLAQALRLAFLGLALGGLAAWAAGRALSSLLFQVAPHDPPALLGALLLTLAVAVLGAWLPARRAGRVDPIGALKEG